LISMRVATEIAGDFPFATDLTVWYADVSIMGIAIIVALAAFGAYTSLAGQPILRSELLEEVRP